MANCLCDAITVIVRFFVICLLITLDQSHKFKGLSIIGYHNLPVNEKVQPDLPGCTIFGNNSRLTICLLLAIFSQGLSGLIEDGRVEISLL